MLEVSIMRINKVGPIMPTGRNLPSNRDSGSKDNQRRKREGKNDFQTIMKKALAQKEEERPVSSKKV